MKKIGRKIFLILYHLSSILIFLWFIGGILATFTGFSFFFSIVSGWEAMVTSWFLFAFVFTTFIPIFPVLIIIIVIDLGIKLKSKNKDNKNEKFFSSVKYNIMTISIVLIVALIVFLYSMQF